MKRVSHPNTLNIQPFSSYNNNPALWWKPEPSQKLKKRSIPNIKVPLSDKEYLLVDATNKTKSLIDKDLAEQDARSTAQFTKAELQKEHLTDLDITKPLHKWPLVYSTTLSNLQVLQPYVIYLPLPCGKFDWPLQTIGIWQ